MKSDTLEYDQIDHRVALHRFNSPDARAAEDFGPHTIADLPRRHVQARQLPLKAFAEGNPDGRTR